MEELNIASYRVLKFRLDDSNVNKEISVVTEKFSSIEPGSGNFRTEPESGRGYQFPIEHDNGISEAVLSMAQEAFDSSFSTEDCWALYQTNDSSIDTPYHTHMTAGWCAVAYLQTNEGDSISFRDDGGNEESLAVTSGDLLLFPFFAEHKPNQNAGENTRISLNFDLVYNEIQEEDLNAISRIDICKDCERFTSLSMCQECNCFMPLKVRIGSASCPLGKW